MATYNLSPIGNEDQQFFGAVGANFPPNLPLNAGVINTFQAGTNTPIATYANNLGSVQNAVSLTLGPDGRFAGAVWLLAGQAYKFQLTDSTGFQIWIIDNVLGINDIGTGITSEWVASNAVPTFSNGTTFTTPGNTTTTFQVGRRVKATVTAGLVYGSVFSSTFGVSTTIVLTMDTGMALDSGLNNVQVALLGESNPSLPLVIPYPTPFIQANSPVAFRAHRSTNQSSGTTIIWDTVDEQSGGTNYSNSTGVFTAPFVGFYIFASSAIFSNTSGGTVTEGIIIQKNSTQISLSMTTVATATSAYVSCSVVVKLAVNDTVNVISNVTMSATNTLTPIQSNNQFSGSLLYRTA